MNLEARATSKGMWWDGQYGGVVKDGKFTLLCNPNYAYTT